MTFHSQIWKVTRLPVGECAQSSPRCIRAHRVGRRNGTAICVAPSQQTKLLCPIYEPQLN